MYWLLLLFIFLMNYFTKLSNNSIKDTDEGRAASALITFPSGPIKINLGIALIPKAFIKSEVQFLSANN